MKMMHKTVRSVKDIANHRLKMEEIGKELGVKELDDWYFVPKYYVRLKAPFIQKNYKSVYNALKSLYPNHSWDYNKFAAPYWNNVELQRHRLNKIGRDIGVVQLDDWYKVHKGTVYERAPFIRHYYSSFYEALQRIYPEHSWNCANFSHASQGQWNTIQNQRLKFDQIGRELGIQQLDDWYSVSQSQVRSKIPFIGTQYNSLFEALKTVYPSHPWSALHFNRISWKQLNYTMIDKLSQLIQQHNIQSTTDWHRIQKEELKLFKSFAAAKYGSFSAMTGSLFPSITPLNNKHELRIQV